MQGIACFLHSPKFRGPFQGNGFVQQISTHETLLSCLFLPLLHGSGGLPCIFPEVLPGPEEHVHGCGAGVPSCPIFCRLKKVFLIFLALTFSDALRHSAAETQNLQVTYSVPLCGREWDSGGIEAWAPLVVSHGPQKDQHHSHSKFL